MKNLVKRTLSLTMALLMVFGIFASATSIFAKEVIENEKYKTNSRKI